MCGIVGIYSKDKKPVGQMLRVLEHRGRDGSSTYTDDTVGLGHTRLAIIDLSKNGIQPMCNEDQSIWLVVNGEIYNYKELREELKSKGHNFKSESDSEVIIHAYERWGNSFVYHIRGMYGLAIYNKNTKELILARDPIGKKPLYYYMDNNKVVFASEIKAILESGVEKLVNHYMIAPFLMYQYSVGRQTLFRGINKLGAGEMMIVKPSGIKFWKYFEISESFNKNTDLQNIEKLRELLDESVKLRLRSDVPVGAFLSGGIDSSGIIALAKKHSEGEFHTFTATFDTFSEAQYAKRVSQFLNVKYHEVPIIPKMVAHDMEKITWHHDEPLGDAAIINNYYLANEASKYVKVVLAGEGGDEIFGGYPWYKFVHYISLADRIPVFLRRWGQKLIGNCDPTSNIERYRRMLLFPLQTDLMKLELYPETSMSANNLSWLSIADNHVCPIVPHNINSPYNHQLATDCLNLLPEKFLMKADKATMANTIEERLPLLDNEVIEFAFSLPIHLKKDKYILRQAVKDLLPEDIVNRGKTGFGTPIAHWLNDKQMHEMVIESLEHGKLLNGICNKKSLLKLSNYVRNNRLENKHPIALSLSGIIWNLLALQIWHKVYFK